MLSSERSEASRGRIDAKMGPKRWAGVMAAAMAKMNGDDMVRLLALPGLPTPETNAEVLSDALRLACARTDCPSLLPWIRRFNSAGSSSLLSLLSGVPARGEWRESCLGVATEMAKNNEASRGDLIAWHAKSGGGIAELVEWLEAGWSMGDYACQAMSAAGTASNGIAIFWWAKHFGDRVDEHAWMPALNVACGALVNKELMQAMQDAGAPWDKHAKEALIIAVNRGNFEATSWLVGRGHRLPEAMLAKHHEVYENALLRHELASKEHQAIPDRSKPRL